MKKILILLPILLVSTFVLTGCNTEPEVDTDAIITQLQTELRQATERSNALLEELTVEETADEIVDGDDDMIIELSKTPVNPVAPHITEWLNINFGNQPAQAPGDYTSNTAQLNEYAHSNMVWLAVPAYATTMTINLEKDVIDNGRNIVMYVETKGRHCGWRILWAELGEVKWSSFTFDLTNMSAYPTTCWGNRADKINWKNIAVGWYVTTYDGNWFNSITFN